MLNETSTFQHKVKKYLIINYDIIHFIIGTDMVH